MIRWAIIFFLISLVAGFFGFTNVAVRAKRIAQLLFFVALVMFMLIVIFGIMLGMLLF